jgi:hypothetical protein
MASKGGYCSGNGPKIWVLQAGYCYRLLRTKTMAQNLNTGHKKQIQGKILWTCFWKILISKPGLWVDPAFLTPVNSGLLNSRVVK